MKTITRVFLIASALSAGFALWPHTLIAQCSVQAGVSNPTCTTRTTLAANAAADDSVINVTSATGFTANNKIWVDFEQMHIISVTGTLIRVRRGDNGTRSEAHDNADAVFTGDPAHFQTSDPNFGQDCTRGTGQAAYLPWINVRTGWMWTCDNGLTTTDWRATQKGLRTLDSEPTTF